METNETFEPLAPEPGLILTLQAQSYLREAGKWSYFLGIVGFIFCAFIFICALFAGTIFTKLAELSPTPAAVTLAGLGSFITVFYILIDVIYFFFSLYLFQFGDKIKKGIVFSDTATLTTALEKLKSFFKLLGILTIVALCFYALLILGFLVVGISAASMMHR